MKSKDQATAEAGCSAIDYATRPAEYIERQKADQMKMLRIGNCWVKPEAIDAVRDTTEGCYPAPFRMTKVILRSGKILKFPGWIGKEICKKLDSMEAEVK